MLLKNIRRPCSGESLRPGKLRGHQRRRRRRRNVPTVCRWLVNLKSGENGRLLKFILHWISSLIMSRPSFDEKVICYPIKN